jgi:uncharacterized protein (TIRG00374 family)
VIGKVLRILVAGGLTAFILWKSDPVAVLRAAQHANLSWILLAILLVLADRALMAYRWLVLLRPLSAASHLALWPVMRIFFVSTFVGTFLPASVGGDAVRAYSLSRLGVPAGPALASVFMDRMLGVVSILLMAALGLVFARDLATHPAVVVALAATLGACVVTTLVLFNSAAAHLARVLLRGLPWARVKRVSGALLDAVQSYAPCHKELLNVLVGSIAVQVLRIVQAYLLGRALGVMASPVAYFAFIPLILLVMLVPVTINGLGTSQWAFLLFGRVGVPGPQSFALSVLFLALGVVGNLPGVFLYLADGLNIGKAGRAPEPRGVEPRA